jgi:hypothetical protein
VIFGHPAQTYRPAPRQSGQPCRIERFPGSQPWRAGVVVQRRGGPLGGWASRNRSIGRVCRLCPQLRVYCCIAVSEVVGQLRSLRPFLRRGNWDSFGVARGSHHETSAASISASGSGRCRAAGLLPICKSANLSDAAGALDRRHSTWRHARHPCPAPSSCFPFAAGG